jgi:micrococcal nuclease
VGVTSEAGTRRSPRWSQALRAWAAIASAVALASAPTGVSAAMRVGVIDHVADGDTVVLRGGETIRLVQIDTPEVYGDTECYGPKASAVTKALLPRGTRVRVATDPRLDQHDRDGRTLAYIWKGSSLVNLRLIRDGDAAPYFYGGDKGRYAALFFSAAVAARNAGKGLWGHCRHGAVPLRPTRGVATGPVRAAKTSKSAACNPNYTPCVPNSKSDLNCSEVGHPVKVIGSDVYNLDGNGDGYGCE